MLVQLHDAFDNASAKSLNVDKFVLVLLCFLLSFYATKHYGFVYLTFALYGVLYEPHCFVVCTKSLVLIMRISALHFRTI